MVTSPNKGRSSWHPGRHRNRLRSRQIRGCSLPCGHQTQPSRVRLTVSPITIFFKNSISRIKFVKSDGYWHKRVSYATRLILLLLETRKNSSENTGSFCLYIKTRHTSFEKYSKRRAERISRACRFALWKNRSGLWEFSFSLAGNKSNTKTLSQPAKALLF